MDDFLNLIFEPITELFQKFKAFLPNFLAMLLILLAGILISLLVKRLLIKFLNAVNFDSWSDRMGFTKLMRRGDLWGKPTSMLAGIVFGLLIAVTLMSGLSALQVPATDRLVEQFFGYIPRILSAVMIMVIGFLVSGFVSRAMLIAASTNGYPHAKLLAKGLHALLIVLIVAMVMEQLQIAPAIVLAAFSILFGGIVAALAISFGVGGIEAARRFIEGEAAKEKEPKDEIDHI